MLDIDKYIRAETRPGFDLTGHLGELDHWDVADAERVAAEEGILLGPAHWEVIDFLHEYYDDHGPAHSASRLTRALEDRFFCEGGRRHLYTLFPRGPVRQACRIAGLPVPRGAADPSFGSVE